MGDTRMVQQATLISKLRKVGNELKREMNIEKINNIKYRICELIAICF